MLDYNGGKMGVVEAGVLVHYFLVVEVAEVVGLGSVVGSRLDDPYTWGVLLCASHFEQNLNLCLTY